MFKVGDRVSPTIPEYYGLSVLHTYTVSRVIERENVWGDKWVGIQLENGIGKYWYSAKNFVLVEEVEKPKPWLKITPPQPAKRELIPFWLNSEVNVNFTKSGNGSDLINIGANWIDKKMLDELVETLTEISKEMRF